MLKGTYHDQKVEIVFLLKSAENTLLGVFLSEKHIGDVIFVLQAYHFALPWVLKEGDASGGWAMTSLLALKRSVGIRNDVFCE